MRTSLLVAVLLGSLTGCGGGALAVPLEPSWSPRLPLGPRLALTATVTPQTTASVDMRMLTVDVGTLEWSGMVGIEWHF